MVDAGNILSKIDINCRRPCDSPRAEPVENTLKLDAGPEAGIDDGLHDLLEHLQKSDPQGVCVSLGNKYQDVPPQLPQNLTVAPHILEYVHNQHTPSRLG